jgi:hypothetical protein
MNVRSMSRAVLITTSVAALLLCIQGCGKSPSAAPAPTATPAPTASPNPAGAAKAGPTAPPEKPPDTSGSTK